MNAKLQLALNEAKVEIRIQFKDVTQGIFADITRNELVMRIQPSEAVYLKLNTKTPGLYTRVIPTEMDLTYKKRFTDSKIPEAYEALLLDTLKGDHSNFVRDDELDVAWKVRLDIEPCRPYINPRLYGIDFHTVATLDRWQGRTSPSPSALSVWLAWSKRAGSVYHEIRIQEK